MSYLNKNQRAKLFEMRKAIDARIADIAETTEKINESISLLRQWKEAIYELNDVRMYKEIPYKCVQAHDATGNPTWTPDVTPSLWMQYHGTTPETARPWVQPTGAHDMYKEGEYMLWTDNNIYKCTYDTTYSPTEYPQAWEVVE